METGRPRVLIVDDDAQALEIMSLYLREIADVTTVIGGKQAIEYVQQQPVDVILLDVNMPIMNGFKVLEQFHNMKECINIPVMFVTELSGKSTVMNSIFMGSDGFLVKPVDKVTLQQKVKELYQKKNRALKQKTILAIDDDMAYLKTIDSYLRDTYNVIIINSAKLALSYLMQHRPDLILLDYQMPLYNGSSFMNMLNRQSDANPIPVIILSGVIDKEVLKDCSAYKPEACLVKPVSKEMLLENIERILKK
ncbi:MAG: response regulator [Thermoflexaceae bacterium]|nr:response regulator [Thermoflexaceae bacterium]